MGVNDGAGSECCSAAGESVIAAARGSGGAEMEVTREGLFSADVGSVKIIIKTHIWVYVFSRFF